jgi:hypothetical protein
MALIKKPQPVNVSGNTIAERTRMTNRKMIMAKVLGGIAFIILAARFAVWSASEFATMLGIPPIL